MTNFWMSALQDVLLLLHEQKLRSSLTILGIGVGIWALVTLLSIGLGARSYVAVQVGQFGTDLLIVTPGNTNDASSFFDRNVQESLRAEDADALRRNLPNLAAAVPIVQLSGEARYFDQRTIARLVGTSPDYFTTRMAEPELGRLLTPADQQAEATVAVLGAEVAQLLFSNRNPLGQRFHFQNTILEVVGVLRNQGDNPLGQGRNDEIIVPLSTAQHRIAGIRHIQMILLKPRSEELKEQVRLNTELELLSRHTSIARKGLPYKVTDLGQLADVAGRLVTAMTAFLASIAAVSLVVGGIGVMNVMLASVRERIGEVGIRRAVGATQKHIRFQFLLEAGVLTALGGLVGIALALVTVMGLDGLLPWSAEVSFAIVSGVLAISAAIGVFFGYYPAHMAASLTPMEALRYE